MKTIKVRQLNSLVDRTRGLIGTDTAEAVLITTRFGIHTFGVRFPIDVVILDGQNYVVKTKENLLPNRIFVWPWKYDTVIELPAGEISKKRITQGNKIQLR